MIALLGHWLYLVWLLGTALPIVLLQWLLFGRVLVRQLRAIALGALLPAVYLSIADARAIGAHIWFFSDELTLGARVFGVPIEELLFFLLTSLLVTQTLTLFTSHGFPKKGPIRPEK